MNHWNKITREEEQNADVDAFLHEISIICKKYNLSLGHEDNQGAFLIEEFKNDNIEWLNAAHLNINNEV